MLGKKTRILFVLTKLELGGAQKSLLQLISGLDNNIFEPLLFTSGDGFLVDDAQKLLGERIRFSRALDRPVHVFKDICALFELYWFIRTHDVQIVHTHSSKAGVLGRIAAKAAGIKAVVHTIHGWSFHDYQATFVRIFCVWIEKLCAALSDKLIFVSRHDRQKGECLGIGKEGKSEDIPCGVDRQEFVNASTKEEARAVLGLKRDDLVVGTVACFKPQKAPLDLVWLAERAQREHKNVKFVMVGDGVLREDVEQAIAKAGLRQNVILCGWRRDIALILKAFDVFALTSRWEGLPVSVLEAMFVGVPVVVTDTGGVREVVEDGQTGMLASKVDERFYQRLSLLLNDPELRALLAGRAKKVVLEDRFSVSEMIRRTEDVYLDLIGRKR